jgi:hypothetical protein
MKLLASSNSIVSERLLGASSRMGTLEALKLRRVGGMTPGGICFSTLCDIAETSPCCRKVH